MYKYLVRIHYSADLSNVLPHPPYSPDQATSHYFIFCSLQNQHLINAKPGKRDWIWRTGGSKAKVKVIWCEDEKSFIGSKIASELNG